MGINSRLGMLTIPNKKKLFSRISVWGRRHTCMVVQLSINLEQSFKCLPIVTKNMLWFIYTEQWFKYSCADSCIQLPHTIQFSTLQDNCCARELQIWTANIYPLPASWRCWWLPYKTRKVRKNESNMKWLQHPTSDRIPLNPLPKRSMFPKFLSVNNNMINIVGMGKEREATKLLKQNAIFQIKPLK